MYNTGWYNKSLISHKFYSSPIRPNQGTNSRERETFACKICNLPFQENFHSVHGYVTHYRTEHNDIPPEFVDKEKFLCSECPEIYFSKSNFKVHVRKHKEKEIKEYLCQKCDVKISGQKNYVSHCKKVHNEIASVIGKSNFWF